MSLENKIPYMMLLVGILFSVFGFRVVFQKGYVEKLQKGCWKEDEGSPYVGKEWYNYAKYVRGLRFLFSGLVLILFAILILFDL